MTEPSLALVALSLAGPFAVALFLLFGQYQRERRLTPRLRDADEFKRRLYELVEICAEYWSVDHDQGKPPSTRRQELEARVVAAKHIVSSQSRVLRARSRKLDKWHAATRIYRMRLMDEVAGGTFQQRDWKPEPQRVRSVAREVDHIIAALNKAV